MKENCYRDTVIPDRITRNETTLGLCPILQWNFQSALKFEGKTIRWTNWMFAALKRYPWDAIVRLWKRRSSDIAWMEVSNVTSSIFHFCGTLVFSIVFYIVSRAIVQMIDREKTCGNVTTLNIFVCIIRPWTRCELKKLKGWSIAAVVNDVLILFGMVLSCDIRVRKFHEIFPCSFNARGKWKVRYMACQ